MGLSIYDIGWFKKRKKGSFGLTEQKDISDSLFGFEKRPGMHLFELYLNCSGIVFYTTNILKIFKNEDRGSISNVKKVLHKPSESKNGKAEIDLYILVSVEVGK
jgi:hypothetical protein